MSYKDQCISASDQALLEWYECYKQVCPDYLGLDLTEQVSKLTAGKSAFDIESVFGDEVSCPTALGQGYFGINDAATYLGISTSKLYKMTASKQILCRKIGTRITFSKADLDAYSDSMVVEPVQAIAANPLLQMLAKGGSTSSSLKSEYQSQSGRKPNLQRGR